ncbi:DNA-3-methyladenine glycosylase [Subtercola boreus]|uniref:Putative 3-methyladenine DNA glycosylase n=1 Tax=Subtercola boreus TaxID=120213 RepID=A0A3E0WC86_9MICO|nr:DNA-3-methyladenine glycosylase [Subtercola boreus]RFA21862.1 3-methyladenine DNA glycosylase [Subtercola boreus]RFA21973.1 3-methyladenine DNA glycosylase [Subtercola boreus]RFA27921.1 3-methyladenine DNA glycosylase [Subtercola boreus]
MPDAAPLGAGGVGPPVSVEVGPPLTALGRALFLRPAVEVAPLLLGGILSRTSPEGTVAVRITEVEAYLGVGEDPGSHSFRGQTRSNSVMFGEPLRLYTYFTYGMHTCANIVCSAPGTASGVLLRAGEIVEGVDLAQHRRGPAVKLRDLARGPARLVVALGIPLDDGGADLTEVPYALRMPVHPSPVATSPRTGLGGPGGTPVYPWRFFIPGDPTVSPYKRHPRLPPFETA